VSDPGGAAGGASRLWRQPRAWFLLGIPLGGLIAFLVGIAFTGGALAGLKYAETTAFCTSCHEMQTPAAELRESVHGMNVPGIRPECGQCHIPPAFWAGLWRHVEASTEVWGHLTGKLGTPAKFEALRPQLAQDIWQELKANDSAECRSCHSYAAMALDKQDPTAAKRHSSDYLAKTGKTCIDCHKGVAHHLPAGA
jgi:cytochrome c-type protein NapC